MIPKKIELYNRYNDKNYLEKVQDNKYKLCLENHYLRMINNEDGSIRAVDPSGGPFIAKEGYIDGFYFTKLNKLKNIKVKVLDIERTDSGFIISTAQ